MSGGDGVTVTLGMDEPVVSLWDTGVVRVGSVADLARTIRDVTDGEEPLTVYLPERGQLAEAEVIITHGAGDFVTVVVTRAAPGRQRVAEAFYWR